MEHFGWYSNWKGGRMKATGQHAKLLVESAAAQYGIRSQVDGHGKSHWIVKCTECGTEKSVFNASVNDSNWLVNHFTKHGWVFDRKVAQYCSTTHAREAKERQRQLRKEEEMKHEPTPPPAPVQGVESVSVVPPIGPDPKIVRQVITLLNDHFNSTKRLYEPGWDDARVAKESQASLEFVTKYRREGYGELAEDPQIAQFRADLKAMGELYHQSLKSLEQSFAQQLGEMNSRLERLMSLRPKAGG
jgi:hypothetical protein